MMSDISTSGPALKGLLAALLCLLSACDNGASDGEVFQDALKGGGQGPEMVVLPTGSFRMGSPPLRTVNISKRIAMGRYEVTFADYDRFVAATSGRRPSDHGWGRGSRPVIDVSWNEAKAYTAWLSAQTGKPYRLPSESEWEYAARAVTRTRYNLGSVWDNRQTAPVGSFAANGFGLFDMHGNVWEWVEDCWHDSDRGAPMDGRAWTTNCDQRRAVIRGVWANGPQFVRSMYRMGGRPSSRDNYIGFRLVQDLNP